MYTADVDIEPELEAPGSEIEEKDVVDVPLGHLAECDDLVDPNLTKDVASMGAQADVALRVMADPADDDVLFFDWHCDFNQFEGVREVFTGPSGPTFDVTGLTPLEVFQKIWDSCIIDHIVTETNRYARQMLEGALKANFRVSRWRDTTAEEIWRFLTVIMF